MSIYSNETINENHEAEYENIKEQIKKEKYKTLKDIEIKYPDNLKIQSGIIKRYINDLRYDKAIEICEKYPNYGVIQSQRVTIHIAKNEYNEALQICNQFSNRPELQSQLVTVYTKLKKYNEAHEICDKFIECDKFKTQKIKIYLCEKKYNEALALCDNYPHCIPLQELKLLINKLMIDTEENEIQSTNSQMIMTEEDNTTLCKIRFKLANNTIQTEDLATVAQLETKLDINIYKFVLIAIYHKLGLKKTALQILKTIDSTYSQYKGTLYNILSSKKNTLYDLGIYDQIINWYDDNIMMFQNSMTIVKKGRF